jgi:predicted transcriptional regulator
MPTCHPRTGYGDGAGQHRPVGAQTMGADVAVARGGFGELEQAIMEVVWSADRAVTGREVVDELARSRPVVYTTVLTVMDRLVRKGILEKYPNGKAHTYRAVQSRETYTAQRMASLLGSGGDPAAVLLRFVEQLPPEQATRLRAALQADHPQPTPREP